MIHLLRTRDTPVAQKIPKDLEAVCQDQRRDDRLALSNKGSRSSVPGTKAERKHSKKIFS
jgi:hypothetical protein